MYKRYEEVQDRWKVSELVWFSIEPEAGRWPEICLSGAESAGELAVAV